MLQVKIQAKLDVRDLFENIFLLPQKMALGTQGPQIKRTGFISVRWVPMSIFVKFGSVFQLRPLGSPATISFSYWDPFIKDMALLQ